MSVLYSAFGYLALLAIAWLTGKRSRLIPWKTIGVATFLQLALTAVLIQPFIRQPLFRLIGQLVGLLQATALKANESLLFSGITGERFTLDYGPIFALELAGVLIFVAALSRLLYHYRILPWVIALLSRCMQRFMGISSAESVGAAGNIFLGMTEAPLLIRPYVHRLTESELFCLMTGGMATIAGTVMILYATMLGNVFPDIAGHLFIASLISAPAAIAVAKLMIPETETPETGHRQVKLPRDKTRNGLDAAAQGAAEGMHLVINIVAMLIAFIGLVALVNHLLGWVDLLITGRQTAAWSLQAIAGFFFRPLVWLMGIPWSESQLVGELMGLKTVLNEFVAYSQLLARMQESNPLSERTFVITTYALCGFANFGSVAIMIGGLGGLAPKRRGDLARLGLRSIVAGSLATMLTGCIIGIFI